ncbi:MAG: site-2 protease family protein, partial [Candidatus Gastranaerophilales bacterium]|nr:site-2 protease family protein [Candidatus Gastranaerophilales bacterium]
MHIITMLLLLSVLILIHELGHFSVAKLFKLQVNRFGFGLPFGPTLWEKKFGETTVCIHSFLLGGYVSFPDDDPDSNLPEDDKKRLSNRPVWQRFWVISAGVIANAILALVLVIFVAGFSGNIPSGKYNIFVAGLQEDKHFAAHQTDIQKDDLIVAANGVKIDMPMKFIEIAQRSKKFDNYATSENIEKQKVELLKLNPNLTENIDKNTKILLPAPVIESPISLEKSYIPGVSEYKPIGEKLNETQITLRDKISEKSAFVTDNPMTVSDIAFALSDNVHPIIITVQRGDELIDLQPAYPDMDGIIGIKLKIEESLTPVNSPIAMLKGSWDY